MTVATSCARDHSKWNCPSRIAEISTLQHSDLWTCLEHWAPKIVQPTLRCWLKWSKHMLFFSGQRRIPHAPARFRPCKDSFHKAPRVVAEASPDHSWQMLKLSARYGMTKYFFGGPGMGVPPNGKIQLKWMIWGYPYFRKPPFRLVSTLNDTWKLHMKLRCVGSQYWGTQKSIETRG